MAKIAVEARRRVARKTRRLNIASAVRCIERFAEGDLGTRIGLLEANSSNASRRDILKLCASSEITTQLFESALFLKKVAGQVNVVIHALGILLTLPHILKKGEIVEKLSLGAGNMGRKFDLETSERIAEFKFIQWRGGRDSIRQDNLFKDFYSSAEAKTRKLREIYLMERDRPLNFLKGGRAVENVLKKKDHTNFLKKHGNRFHTVGEYFQYRRTRVSIRDLTTIVPELVSILDALDLDT